MKNPNPIEIIGVGLVKLSELLSHNSISVLFQKGIGLQLIHKIIEINKSKILDKKTGFLIDLISNYTVYIHFWIKELDMDIGGFYKSICDVFYYYFLCCC